ncbi:hypothetical protein RO1_12660 [Roseburia intestinalis XB6B4]|uniref:Uncharacterized protein n=1 Tax=Roseburia intestinalis XB6B4 TaxID=718255 RepID=D4KX09_9FIRM|nr:hypothetical protein RO1_12660 [Roseburia intestinalis XB6B4]
MRAEQKSVLGNFGIGKYNKFL